MKPFDENGVFHAHADGDGLRRLAIRSAGVTVFAQAVGFAIQLGATVVLARILTPADFGLVAMVSTFSLLLVNFGLNGFTEAVQQREEMDHVLASNLFWINVGLGLLLTIGFAASGVLLARLYGDPRIPGITVAMSATILLTSVSVLHLALLRRGMRFSIVSANDIIARALSVGISIVLGWMAWGYWALVVGAVVLPLATTIAAWRACRWVPGAPRRHESTGSMVRFAANTYGRFVIDYSTRNLDNLLIGWHFGPQALGFYKKAYDLFLLPASQLLAPLTNVAISTFSRLRRDPVHRARQFVIVLSTFAFIGMGLAGMLTLTGKDLIFLLLGPEWEESGRIFVIFGPGIGMMLLYGTHSWIHLSIGRADRWLKWSIVHFSATTILFLLGLRWGPPGVAMAWVASYWILAVPGIWYAGRQAQIPIGPVIGAVWKYIVSSAIASWATVAVLREVSVFMAESSAVEALMRIAVASSLFGVFYLGMVILLHRGCAPLAQLAAFIEEMLPKHKWSRSSPAVAKDPLVATQL
jgi:PST family polysaccharide transporter